MKNWQELDDGLYWIETEQGEWLIIEKIGQSAKGGKPDLEFIIKCKVTLPCSTGT